MPFTRPDGGEGVVVILCMKFDHRAPVQGRVRFRTALLAWPAVEVAMEVSGTFDLILEVRVPSLSDYSHAISAFSNDLRTYVERYETCFLCSRIIDAAQGPAFPREFWLACTDGHRRVDVEDITHITAERDYMRLHLKDGQSCLMHVTARKLLDSLDPSVFVQIHRSTIVRRSFVQCFIQQGRHWRARFRNGEESPVAKSHELEALPH